MCCGSLLCQFSEVASSALYSTFRTPVKLIRVRRKALNLTNPQELRYVSLLGLLLWLSLTEPNLTLPYFTLHNLPKNGR